MNVVALRLPVLFGPFNCLLVWRFHILTPSTPTWIEMILIGTGKIYQFVHADWFTCIGLFLRVLNAKTMKTTSSLLCPGKGSGSCGYRISGIHSDIDSYTHDVTIAGNALSKHLTVILNSIVKVLEGCPEPDEELKIAVKKALEALFGSISDAEGLNILMMLLLCW
ncbi:hypothetical protein BT96DRAFT_946769 [Gymnopus androsaceus JB14]|uniref:Stalled ribosome sensor GCN1-like HEAT repeats region domain-containing protein n=1 Tax=Gymnopus androsaceus JB14 TaxID=1447944 RepID=A0A6A4GWZ0_9AGAR|nr:hypothetical protein BT96DRAFT_946769 [Gymnopus androsaceus JB14]